MSVLFCYAQSAYSVEAYTQPASISRPSNEMNKNDRPAPYIERSRSNCQAITYTKLLWQSSVRINKRDNRESGIIYIYSPSTLRDWSRSGAAFNNKGSPRESRDLRSFGDISTTLFVC